MALESQPKARPVLVVAGALLVAFGSAAILSIGFPFLVAGLLTLVAGLTDVHRQRPTAFWPLTLGVAAFFVGYLLVAPLSCSSRAGGEVATAPAEPGPGGDESIGATECTNLLDIDYSGGPGYNPPLWPAVLVGTVGASSLGWVARRLMTRRRRLAK